MDDFLRDARFGFRLLWKQKAFSLTAALTLAICIAANVAIFSVVYNVILKPLPFPDSGRLVHIYNSYPKAGVQYGSTGVPDYYDRKSATDVFEEVAAFNFTRADAGSTGRSRAHNRDASNAVALSSVAGSASHGQGPRRERRPGRQRACRRAERRALEADIRRTRRSARTACPVERHSVHGDWRDAAGVPVLEHEVSAWIPLAFTPEQKAPERRHGNMLTTVARLRPA
jgi:hypothetical protein